MRLSIVHLVVQAGWTVILVRRKLIFLGDLDNIQFQPILQDITDDTVVPC